MKKWIAIITIACMVLTLCACGGSASAPAKETQSKTESTAEAAQVQSAETAKSEAPTAEEPAPAAEEPAPAAEEPAPAAAEPDVKPIELKLACHDPSTSLVAQGLNDLADKLKEETNGRVVITGYYDASLGAAADGLTMLDTGVCDVLWTTTSFFAGQFPMCELFTMPMMNPGSEENLTNVFWDLYEKNPEYFENEFEGYHPIAVYCGGRGAFGTKFEVTSLSDYQGKTMRAVTGPLNIMATSLGINPVMMAPPDLFLSMEKGVIDGFMVPMVAAGSFSLGEVMDYCYIYGSSSFDNILMILVKDETWDKISPEDQEIIMDVYGRNGSLYMANVFCYQADLVEEDLGDKCIHITEGEQYDQFTDLAKQCSLEYLAQQESEDCPVTEAYEYILEQLKSYRD